MAAFTSVWWIFFARTVDRTGKGLRTGARDAMLSDASTEATKGRVFGFHRAMDTTGAMIGPSLTLIFLYFAPQQYRQLFLWALLPGIAAIITTFLIKEKKAAPAKKKEFPSFKSFYQYWQQAPSSYKKLTGALLAFALFNSSDALLLLRMKETGTSDTELIFVYIFYNAVYAVLSYPLGAMADKIGLKKVFISGLILFAMVYAGMTVNSNLYWYAGLFLLYGLYAAATEGISKAWITNITAKADTATAIGTYTGFQSICTMLASSITGWIWFSFGANLAFYITSFVTLLIVIYLLIVRIPEQN